MAKYILKILRREHRKTLCTKELNLTNVHHKGFFSKKIFYMKDKRTPLFTLANNNMKDKGLEI